MDEEKSSGFLELNLQVLLHNFLKTAKRLIWLVLLLALLVGAFMYIRTDRSYTPRYSSSAVFSVKACYTSTTDLTSSNPYLDSNAAQMLSQTFPYIIASDNTQMLLQLGRASCRERV